MAPPTQKGISVPGSGYSGATFLPDYVALIKSIAANRAGTSRPSDIQDGECWLDTTSATAWALNLYDGTQDVNLATINSTAHTVTFSGLVIGTNVQAYDADILKADTSDVLTAGFLQAATTITDAATPTIDLTASNHFLWTLGDDRTFPDLSPTAAGRWLFQISGNYTLSFDGAYTVYGDTYDGSGTNSNLVLLVFDGTNKKMYVKSIAVAA